MLDIKYIREHRNDVLNMLRARRTEADIEQLMRFDGRYRELLQNQQNLQNERNTLSKEIGQRKKERKDSNDIQMKVVAINEQLTALNSDVDEIKQQITTLMLTIPNLLSRDVPEGDNENQNIEIRKWGTIPSFDFPPKDHIEIGELLGIVDMKRAAKIAGARFALLRNWGARLEWALINFMRDIHVKEHGYNEIIPPFIVNKEALIGASQLPKFEEDLFHLQNTDLYLVPTAEVPLVNVYQSEIIKASALPIKFMAYTPCFRSEAGSYGKDVRGLIRLHQFNKVELVQIVHPQQSEAIHEEITRHAETILQKLELPYRVVTLSSGDVGFGSYKTYDLEVWLPSQETYREISSSSNCIDFQARRAKIRFKNSETGKNEYVHTLNASGLAVGRTFLAILENYQQKDGSVIIPTVLRPYLDGLERLQRK